MEYSKLNRFINDAVVALLQAKEGQANQLLAKMFDELLNISASLKPETLMELSQIMEIMHDAQQRRDYVYLVDILQYELPKHIVLGNY